MEQNPSFIRISELMNMAKPHSSPPGTDCNQTLALIERVFRSIDRMSNGEREAIMRRLTSWMLVEKFEAKGHAALVGVQEYCMADCFDEDPTWSPPEDVLVLKHLPDTY